MTSTYIWLPYLTDQATGDGTDIGFCPTSPAGLRCLSSKECRICKWISPNYEGCDVTSVTPVCDSDADDSVVTTGILTSDDPAKPAQCVGCKQSSTYLSCATNYIY